MEVYVGLCMDDVENLAFLFINGFLGFQLDSMIFVILMVWFYDQCFQWFNVKDEKDQEVVVLLFGMQLEEVGLLFFEVYSMFLVFD